MSRVFISYSAEDRDFILKIASDLHQANHFVWLDVWEITGRKPYWSEIQEGIETCSYFLFAVSPDSIDPEGGASIELHHAAGLKPPRRPVIVPIVVRPTPYEAFPILISPGRLQIHDFSQHPYDVVLSRVLKALEPKEEPLPPIPRSVDSRPPAVSRHKRQPLLLVGAVIVLVLIGGLFAVLTSRNSPPGTKTAVALANSDQFPTQTTVGLSASDTPPSPQSTIVLPTTATPTDTNSPPTSTATFTNTVNAQATQAILNRTNTAVAVASFTRTPTNTTTPSQTSTPTNTFTSTIDIQATQSIRNRTSTAVAVASFTKTPTSTATPTQTLLPTATLTHTADVQATQNVRATATASVEQMTAVAFFAQQATLAAQDMMNTATAVLRNATGTAIQRATLAAQQTRIAAPPSPTAAPTRNAVDATATYLTRSAIRVFGPTSGSLLHSSSNFVTVKSANINLADFIVEARFYNPYQASDTQRWDYGFFFRNEGSDKQYRLRVVSDKTWALDYGIEDGIAVGAINNLDVTQAGFNHLKLIVEGNRAFFYVNNSYVASLDVSQHRSVGAIAVATGFYSGYKMDGRSTQYDSFAVSTLNAQQATSVVGVNIEATVTGLMRSASKVYGPTAGRLAHTAGDNQTVVQNSGINLADFVAEVRFYNPYSATASVGWDYGLLFHDQVQTVNEQYRLVVSSDKSWALNYGVGDYIAYGSLDNLDTSETGSNLLRLVVRGDTAFFYVNNKYIATLDVSQHPKPGYIRVVTGAQSAHEMNGKATRFDSFTIWRLA